MKSNRRLYARFRNPSNFMIYTKGLHEKQKEDRFWDNVSDAFFQGYSDCSTIPAKECFDPVNNYFDHDYNPFVTRSQEWEDYCKGCKEYYERNVKGG